MLKVSKISLLSLSCLAGTLICSASANAQVIGQRGPFDTCSTTQHVVAPTQTVALDACCAPVECGCAETTFVPKQEVTYRNVTETHYRQEQFTQLVPVTVYQQRTATRMVPYTVTRQVPQVHTVYQPQTVYRSYTAYGMQPITTTYAPVISQPVAPLQAYTPVTPQTASKLPPNPQALDLNELNRKVPNYDSTPASSQIGTTPRRRIGRSAAQVFRTFQ